MSQSHNSIVLKKNNEERFNFLWSQFAKTEANSMKLSEFMQFVIDRCLVTNRTTLKHFYELFLRGTQKRLETEATVSGVVMQKIIKKEEFIFVLNELGKIVYHNDKHHQDKVYNDLLSEKTMVQKDSMQYSRVMVMDETNRKMMLQNAVETLCSYQQELKDIYLIYVQENYWAMKRQGRILLNHREIELQNKRISAVSFVRFLKEADVVPHLLNIQHVEQILLKVIPPTVPKQNEFYYRHFLVQCYSKNLQSSEAKSEGDPGLALFQFMIALARIAVEISKETDIAKKAYDLVITKFFQKYLAIRNAKEIRQGKPMVSINKSFQNKLKEYYRFIADQIAEEQSEEDEYYNPFQQIKIKELELHQKQPIQLNIPAMLRALNTQLQPLPDPLKVDPEQVPAGKKFKDLEKIVIGQQLPAEKKDKAKPPQKPPPKKQNLKKGEKPPRVFKYQDQQKQTRKIQSAEDYLNKLATDLDYSLKPLSSLERGTIPLDPFPSLITEILYPQDIPEPVLPFIEAGINAHNEGMFALALQNYSKAQVAWKETLNGVQLSANLELYFEHTKGSVYLSAGKDDYAFNSFFTCRGFLDRIPHLNPDRALPFCGMGESLYNAEQYELSTRCYLKARQIRQSLLGVESVDTATVFNNLGCGFFMLSRPKEALSYFKVAMAVLVAQLGDFHQRAQTAKENINLCNKCFFSNQPEYRKLWQVYEKDPFGKKKKKKKKKKK